MGLSIHDRMLLSNPVCTAHTLWVGTCINYRPTLCNQGRYRNLKPIPQQNCKGTACPRTQTEKEAAEETDQDVREDHSMSEAIWPPRTPSEQGKCLPLVVSTLADSSRSHSGLQNKTPPLISSLPLQKRGRYTFD